MGWKALRGRRTTIYSPFVTLMRLLKMSGNTEIVDMTACYVVTLLLLLQLKHQVGGLNGLAKGVQQDDSSGKRCGV